MKIKVRKVKYKNIFSATPENYEEIELDCKGTGTKEDPIIIDSLIDKSLNFDIVESEKYIVIKNSSLRFLCFYYSKNTSVINCKVRNLRLGNCENIHIEKVVCSFIEIVESHNCSLIESRAEETISLYKSHNNIFRKCEFWNFFTDFHMLSRNNIFEENKVPDPEEFVFKSIQDTDLEEKNTYLINCHSNFYGYESCEVTCTGNGTKEDPYIIDGLDSIDHKINTVELLNKRDHVIFKNIDIEGLKLYDIKNVQLTDSSFSGILLLKFCSQIKIDQIYAKKLKFAASEDIDISYSEFNKIDTVKGFTSKIKLNNCSYKKINNTLLE
ncbi:MAG: hypothetical protein ACFFEN_10480 [Candidatus Thorarchaeota archaeon]